ncbi:MAG: hypothetical protein ACI87W_003381 [Halieaceae bacterium]|jgi:hypothetical protein
MIRRRFYLALLLLVASATTQAADAPRLADFPFWKNMSGLWASENTYFTADMDYTIRNYNSLVRIELHGSTFKETEHRFYPSGIATSRYGQGLMGPDEGIELIITTTGELMDHAGTLGNIRADHSSGPFNPHRVYRVLGADDGVRAAPNPQTGVDSYRMYFNFTTPNHRFRSNFGLVYDTADDVGALRAFILYRDKRIDEAGFAAKRAEFRTRNNVKLISVVDPDNPGKSKLSRLE